MFAEVDMLEQEIEKLLLQYNTIYFQILNHNIIMIAVPYK